MTHPDRTAIALVVDRSGSMAGIRDEAQGALDAFIAEQTKQPGEVLWTIVMFNHDYERPFRNESLEGVTGPWVQLVPRGTTALFDAVGRTVHDLGTDLAAMSEDERPSKVVVAILTDGHENSSKDYSGTQVQRMVEGQRNEWNWEFVFLATGLDKFDAIALSASVGVAAGQTVAVGRDRHYAGGQTVSSYVADYRQTGQSRDIDDPE